MWKLVKSIIKSAGKGVANDPEIKKLESRHPKFTSWLVRRLDPEYKFGLYLSVGTVITVVFVLLFFSIIQDVVANDPLALADVRIANLFVMFRSPQLSRFMLFFTYVGKWESVVFATILFSVILLLMNKKRYSFALITSVAGGQLLVEILKKIISRPRPPLANAVITENNFSFPSGHAFVVFSFFALAAFIIWRLVKNRATKTLVVFFGAALFFVIPISRLYLGVHWTSDILASVYLGLAWFTGFATYLIIQDKFKPEEGKPLVEARAIQVLSLIFTLLWGGYLVYYYSNNSYAKVTSSKTENIQTTAISPAGIPDRLFANLPRTSETLTGKPMEPINFIFIGSKSSLDKAFSDAGWLKTDQIGPSTTLRIAYDTLFNKPYPTAPGTPSFWDSRPNDYSYEKPTSTVREREHIHIWSTPFTVNGEPVWFGTAHKDKGVGLSSSSLPTHEIVPDIDNERNDLENQLLRTNDTASIKAVRLVEPTAGRNAAGSNFFTDGLAYIIYFK